MTVSWVNQAPAIETSKIGALLPLSEGAAPWGLGSLRALQLIAAKMNSEDSFKVGGKKYTIETVRADTKSNYDVALAQANKLIFSDMVRSIYGPIISGEILGNLPVKEANKTIVMSFGSASKILGGDEQYSYSSLLKIQLSFRGFVGLFRA
jgi:ABC-type branched-subunit amino acid transport system substrate-binding protein